MTERIFLIGFMGSGKSSIGERLAQRMGWQFVDTDRLIEATHHTTIAQIFAQQGESAFRAIEREVLAQLLPQRHIVVATGGGMACKQENIDKMNAAGTTVYLQASAENLAIWLKSERQNRPLIAQQSEEQLYQYIVQTLSQREKFYQQATFTIRVDQNYTTDNEMVGRIVNLL